MASTASSLLVFTSASGLPEAPREHAHKQVGGLPLPDLVGTDYLVVFLYLCAWVCAEAAVVGLQGRLLFGEG